MQKKSTKYGITIGIALGVGLLCALILMSKFSKTSSFGLALIPTLMVVLLGVMRIEKKNHENYEQDGCNQTINIYQNCGDKPGPGPKPGPSPTLKKSDIIAWIKSVDPHLTSGCQDCITDNALKLWKYDDLIKVKHMPIERQKPILNAMLVLDCHSQCIVQPSGLNRGVIAKWVASMDASLSPDCQNCVVDHIMKLWSPSDFAKVESFDKGKQIMVIQGVLALNCQTCKTTPKINKADVEKWLTTILTGAKPDCYGCVVSTIMNLWPLDQFDKVKAMNKQSQVQVVQALIALNCQKECVAVPTGLNLQEVQQWLSSVFVGASVPCNKCLVDVVMKNWSTKMLSDTKAKPKDEQIKIVEGLIAFNCESLCDGSQKLTKQHISDWLHKILPEIDPKCSACLIDTAYSMWIDSMPTVDDFNKEILSKDCSEQAKIARMVGDYNCPHVCGIPPLDNC